jgi:mannose-6-phosphate isomerase-like protein (cupin superfamily)
MRLVKRNWGHYLTILDRKHFKVKLLRFKEFGRLSRQFHTKRNELWLFLSGKGAFYKDGKMRSEDRSLNGDWHLYNKRDIHEFEAFKPTWVLEIQFGEDCIEEDIIRLHDKN